MRNNDTKIFFTDLDGTLLTSAKTITSVTHDILSLWTAAGNKLVLSSGRALDSVRSVKETLNLNFPGMYLIGSNGGEIYECDTDRILYRTALSYNQVTLVMKKAEEMGIYCHTYTDTHIISPRQSEELTHYCRVIHTPVKIADNVLDALDKEPCKCIAIELHKPEKLEEFRSTLLPLLKGEVTMLYSSNILMEIFPAISGKGTAVSRLCELLNIPVSNSFAAGDECNDISMLQAAGCGIAMKNAKEEVKITADIITSNDNDHDGLSEIMKSFFLPDK